MSREERGVNLSPATWGAEPDPLLLKETRNRGFFCSLAFCICSSKSFHGISFFQVAADKLQST